MSTSDRVPFRARRSAAVLAILTASVPASGAEDKSVEPIDSLDTITVLASRLNQRTAFDSAVPIDVFPAAQVEQALSSFEVGQALQSLSPSINMPRASSSGTSDSVRAIQLRGLAPDQTLVLINGKRRHANAVMDIEGLFPGTVSVDLNAIPPSAIDHLEVLRDGAGAIYGSDAIAGVVNVVLKSGAAGGEVQAGFGENHTHFAPTGASIVDGQNRTFSIDDGIKFGSNGFIRFGGDYQKRDATNRAGPSSASWTSDYSTPADLALDNQILFRSGDPDLQSLNLFYNALLPLASGAELYSFATLGWKSTEGAAFFRYPGDPTNIPAIYPAGFRPISTGHSRDFGWVGGVRGEVASWKWDLSLREGYNTFGYGLHHSLNVALGTDSPTSFHVADFTYVQKAVNLDVTRQVAALAGPLNVSVGAEFLNEKYHTSPGDPASYALGGTDVPGGSQGDTGLAPQDTVDLGRNLTSVYVDLDGEVATHFIVGAAARYARYSDYGSSTTGKFDLRYKFTNDLLVRGSVSTSFRAPALAQTGIRFTTLNFDAYGTGLQPNAWLPPTDPHAQSLGGVALRPERSVNATLGFAARLAPGTSFSVDLYQIRVRDRITPTSQQFVDLPNISSVQFLTNALDTTNRGVDVVASHELDLFGGRLALRGAFNRNSIHEDAERRPDLQQAQVLVPLEYGSPSTKLLIDADWSDARWGAHAGATRFGTMNAFSYDSTQPALLGGNAQRYDPAWTFDLEAHLNVTKALTATLGGTNIFNRYPQRTTFDNSYGGAFPYNYANPLGINGAYYYARLAYRFTH